MSVHYLRFHRVGIQALLQGALCSASHGLESRWRLGCIPFWAPESAELECSGRAMLSVVMALKTSFSYWLMVVKGVLSP